ncbi:glycosyltransferase family 4 protein [Oscillatoria sp. CS-180]|uniref:glycosyltransferase family 4 protein n=1 Tax=Oscillatoria sp. CS-180 TaxID=3021720 RepID=UPI00232B287C|nr:glycosyltransferase family 4 protein [Oscillatoria sp. CS-180]MDB9525339.1 glycosyltransferase family 4 protein [Oscillatoria sp. CS-180]
MKVLMLSATFPYPPTRGGTQVRTFNLLKRLADHHVTFVTQVDESISAEDIAGLKQHVDELKTFRKPVDRVKSGPVGKAMRFAQFWIEGTPPSVWANYTADMQAWIEAAVNSQSFDVLTCEHSVNECYVSKNVQAKVPRRIVNIHSSVYGTCKQQLASGTAEKPLRDRLNLSLLRRYEERYCRKFTDLVVTTLEDAQQMKALSPNRPVHIVTNGVDLDLFPLRTQDPGDHHLVFVGAMDNLPNIDAAQFIAQDIFPQVRQQYPNASLSLVGSRPTPEVKALQEISGVVVTGRVPSMVDYLHKATVCVIPMRAGYGIKNKTLEAMAAGVPVVGSDRGLEGLQVDGAGITLRALRANDTDAYVKAITQLFENSDLRATLSQNARTMIEANYTWQQAGQIYRQLLLS